MRRDDGYTLLEIMVALVVFGLIMAGIAQSFRFGLIAWSATSRNITVPENLAAMDGALSRMTARALPGSMAGLPGEIAFTTMLPPGAGLQGRLADVSILTTPGGALILRYRPHPAGIPLIPAAPPKIETLARGVKSLAISYLTPAQGAPPAWSRNWSGSNLPLLVRFHLTFTNGQNWPDLVAAPLNSGN